MNEIPTGNTQPYTNQDTNIDNGRGSSLQTPTNGIGQNSSSTNTSSSSSREPRISSNIQSVNLPEIRITSSGSDQSILETIISTLMEGYLNDLANPQSEQGLTANEIETHITTFEYKDVPNPINSMCPITMEPFGQSTRVMRINSCGHIFSEIGIRPWVGIRRHCPVCRHSITT
jgi:hypothetical protein